MKYIEQRESNEVKKKSTSELWDNFKQPNIHIIGVTEGEEREDGTKKFLRDYSEFNENYNPKD